MEKWFKVVVIHYFLSETVTLVKLLWRWGWFHMIYSLSGAPHNGCFCKTSHSQINPNGVLSQHSACIPHHSPDGNWVTNLGRSFLSFKTLSCNTPRFPTLRICSNTCSFWKTTETRHGAMTGFKVYRGLKKSFFVIPFLRYAQLFLRVVKDGKCRTPLALCSEESTSHMAPPPPVGAGCKQSVSVWWWPKEMNPCNFFSPSKNTKSAVREFFR